eukprot:CAMPEP_0184349374 /NCGR_PEP_ID=MMETSP1089-20130417/32354_1 /TAXON_ID=38269 ORGANISM="Gloeochaete wittrockiana, Strain SAG46.84" /NCGR_SAMPLE_ID=MMETSP1089 /ASSEMBLY_ACC=CAM_ASM_000445 /LENGTH=252 /DNA_ID=CAMNT_0026681527 /DNA_START=47 /DNA_END=805 /DNA_ORIENTATION=-
MPMPTFLDMPLELLLIIFSFAGGDGWTAPDSTRFFANLALRIGSENTFALHLYLRRHCKFLVQNLKKRLESRAPASISEGHIALEYASGELMTTQPPFPDDDTVKWGLGRKYGIRRFPLIDFGLWVKVVVEFKNGLVLEKYVGGLDDESDVLFGGGLYDQQLRSETIYETRRKVKNEEGVSEVHIGRMRMEEGEFSESMSGESGYEIAICCYFAGKRSNWVCQKPSGRCSSRQYIKLLDSPYDAGQDLMEVE